MRFCRALHARALCDAGNPKPQCESHLIVLFVGFFAAWNLAVSLALQGMLGFGSILARLPEAPAMWQVPARERDQRQTEGEREGGRERGREGEGEREREKVRVACLVPRSAVDSEPHGERCSSPPQNLIKKAHK